MADITVQLQGTDELINNLKKIDGSIRSVVAVQAVNAGGIQIENKVRQAGYAPVWHGNLRNSVTTTARNNGGHAEALISFRGIVYARIQEFGGTIYPRNGKYLVFTVKGKKVFARKVTIQGKHYFQRAIDDSQTKVVEAMGDVIKKGMTL